MYRLREKHGCDIRGAPPEYVHTSFYDGMFNAFHYEATQTVLEPLHSIWSRYDKQCWWLTQSYVCLMSDIVYHYRAVHNVELMGVNPTHRPYPRGNFFKPTVIQTITKDIRTVIPKEFQESAETLLQTWEKNYDSRKKGEQTYCVTPTLPCGPDQKPYVY